MESNATGSSDPSKKPVRSAQQDKPYFDPVAYGNGPQDLVTDATENAATTHYEIELGGKRIQYTATAGHLVTVDQSSSKPDAKIFYVAFTADGADRNTRAVTFFYNGGPGSSSVYVLLGSFAPMRIRTSLPSFTPPAPYTIETNTDSLLTGATWYSSTPSAQGTRRQSTRRRTRISGASTRTGARSNSSSSAT